MQAYAATIRTRHELNKRHKIDESVSVQMDVAFSNDERVLAWMRIVFFGGRDVQPVWSVLVKEAAYLTAARHSPGTGSRLCPRACLRASLRGELDRRAGWRAKTRKLRACSPWTPALRLGRAAPRAQRVSLRVDVPVTKMAKADTKTKSSTSTQKRTTKSKKDPAAPKRPLSAYMFFSQDHRERVKQANPEAGFGDVGRLLGAKWKEMSEAEKKPYNDMATRDKARAEAEKAAYSKRR
ncbi:hypothetical protein PaG_04789 [Moesziomyces aphidis]|uniref:HMG box domain-containing protein n=1 Tax=Moesziomyces aphidis TaxID=84754 RepID=W3VJ92_MOEAP|nr:hypothetical protein PaG_04789 [Moesziomyces aphidis]